MKLSPGNIKRPQAPRKEFDLKYGEQESKITVKKLGSSATLAAKDESDRLTEKYVTGYGDPESSEYVPAEPLPSIDDQPVLASSTAFYLATLVSYAQVVDTEDERYTPKEIVLMMHDEGFLSQISAVAGWISTREHKEGNSSGTQGQGSTSTASDGSTPSPNSSNGMTPCLSVSTTDSVETQAQTSQG